MKQCVSCLQPLTAADWRCGACGYAPRTVNGWPSFVAGAVEGAKEFNRSVYTRMIACEEQSFYHRTRRRLILWALGSFFPGMRTFYDLGVGTGFVLDGIRSANPGLELYGSDLALDSLAITTERIGDAATLFHTEAARIPFAQHFDVIGAFDVVEHIQDDVGALRAIHRAVKPGGGALLTVPQHMAFWSRLDAETGHIRRYQGHELADKARAAGFEVVLDTSFMASLFVPQYVSRRLLAKKSTRAFEAEHLLPAPLNRTLEALLSAEIALIRAGVRFPFGGLRMVAGRKPHA